MFMHSEWSGLSILAIFRCVIVFSGFEKITPRYWSKFACCLFKQTDVRPLKICDVCNFGAITGSMCERFVDRILN